MGTECSYDYIFIYYGDLFRSPVLGSFSSKRESQQVTSGYVSLYFKFMFIYCCYKILIYQICHFADVNLVYSDTNYVLDGFHAEFSFTGCPNNCTNYGKCINNVFVVKNCSRALGPNNRIFHLWTQICKKNIGSFDIW